MDPREELLATVATLYYKLNKSQSEIASRLDISSSTVSRLIREAREKGIVEIHVRIPLPRNLELEQDLIDRFGLVDAYVLKTTSDNTNSTLLQAIGQLAAGYVRRVVETFRPGWSIGVAWGTGVHAAVSALPDECAENIDVVQLLGGVGERMVDSADLARIVAQKLGGRHYDLPAPAVVERATARDLFLQETSVCQGIERARSVRLAITGIGAVTDDVSSWLRAGILTRADLQSLRSQGAVGEICGRFFDISGSCENFEINQRVIGIGPEDLHNIPQSIAIARGLSKTRSILGALRGQYIKVLATDDLTARAVIQAASQPLVESAQ